MVLLEPDEVCRFQRHLLQHLSAAGGDGDGHGIHFVQYCAGGTDLCAVFDGEFRGGLYHGDPADFDYRRLFDAELGDHRALYRQDL